MLEYICELLDIHASSLNPQTIELTLTTACSIDSSHRYLNTNGAKYRVGKTPFHSYACKIAL